MNKLGCSVEPTYKWVLCRLIQAYSLGWEWLKRRSTPAVLKGMLESSPLNSRCLMKGCSLACVVLALSVIMTAIPTYAHVSCRDRFRGRCETCCTSSTLDMQAYLQYVMHCKSAHKEFKRELDAYAKLLNLAYLQGLREKSRTYPTRLFIFSHNTSIHTLLDVCVHGVPCTLAHRLARIAS